MTSFEIQNNYHILYQVRAPTFLMMVSETNKNPKSNSVFSKDKSFMMCHRSNLT